MEKEINYKINYKINYEIIYVSIVYIFIFAGLIYLSEGNIPRNYIAIVLFFFFEGPIIIGSKFNKSLNILFILS